ncbi:hypothetical protein [Pedobacter cryophilus]|uniref:Uncharacterized protein n=1 Tax=Pedobacter cryophilus TaxID=2571271 RepID=A0A4U1C422_9SPHI|nr:hypothetical protein [Pedobacter cryophilus]TKB98879.1 hypothetical protein FA046_07125 [Pedobacter cryophilus]
MEIQLFKFKIPNKTINFQDADICLSEPLSYYECRRLVKEKLESMDKVLFGEVSLAFEDNLIIAHGLCQEIVSSGNQ